MNRQSYKRSRINLRIAQPRGPLARFLSVILVGILSASPLLAQQGGSYQITQSVIPGGGGTSTSGTVGVDGTIGQSITGTSSGGTYTVGGGFEPSSNADPTPTPPPINTFVVTNIGDMGPGSLRQVITDANNSAGFDAIAFNIPGAGLQTITPGSPLPTITDAVVIDGFTQPGASANTVATGNNAVIKIELQGINAGAGASGLHITAGDSTVRGLAIYQFETGSVRLQTNGGNYIEGCFLGLLAHGAQSGGGAGLLIESANNIIGGNTPAARNAIVGNSTAAIYLPPGNAGGNIIQGNYIGTNAAGTSGLTSRSVQIETSNNVLGGTAAGAGNLIVSNFDVEINGASGGSPSGNTIQGNLIGLGVDGATLLGNGGVTIYYSPDNIIGGTSAAARNVIARGVLIRYAISVNNQVLGNYIGTNAAGTAASGPASASPGVFIDGSNNNTVGGTQAGAGNVISNGTNGVVISDSLNCVVQGNYIGTNAAGTSAIPNTNNGVMIKSVFGNATANLIGGAVAGARNMISGNVGDGVNISFADGNTVKGNLIGVAADGVSQLSNRANGVNIGFGNNNVIGGTAAGEGNVIAFSGRPGGNDRGSGVNISSGTGNSVRGNSIHSNGNPNLSTIDRGIALAFNAPPNDLCDSDAGANNLQNSPVLTSALSATNSTTVAGTFNSAANTTFEMDFYANASCHVSGNGEGRTYLGSTSVTTDPNCNGSFNVTLPVSLPANQSIITATATDPNGNTSEFSSCTASTPVPTPTPTPTPTATPTPTPDPTCLSVSVPTGLTALTNSTLSVPIDVSDTTGRGIISFDFKLSYDASVITPLATPYDQIGTLSSSYSITVNSSVPGLLVVSGYGIDPLQGMGTLLKLKFNTIGAAPACSSLNLSSFDFNEGTPCANITNGQVCLINGSISGVVKYGTATESVFVPDVTLAAAGTPTVNTTTDINGAYTLSGLGSGPYTVTPSKSGDIDGITSFDAALVAQQVVGLIALSTNQEIAADASGNGTITSFDAALIAQTAVGLTNPGFAGTWKFVPASRSYPGTITDLAGENYDAILIGEVSGNWAHASGNPRPEARASSETPIPVILPNQIGAPGSIVLVPLTVATDLTGKNIVSYDLDVAFDPNVLQPLSSATSSAGTASSGMTITVNTSIAGHLRVGAFGATPLAGSGTLLNLKFTVVGAPGTSTPLSQSFEFNEGTPSSQSINGRFSVASPTASGATVSGRIVGNDGQPVEGVGVRLSGTQNRLTVSDSAGNYRFANVETNGFYAVTPTRANFTFMPVQRSFSQLGQHTDATFSASANGDAMNPLDTTEYFVRQQYVDFLGREPDEAGLNFWINNIESCGNDVGCREVKRMDTSAAFFLSIEFQETGFLIHRLNRASFGRLTNNREFVPDAQEIGRGVVVNSPGWEILLEANKQTFITEFAARADFQAIYGGMTNAQYVDALNSNTGGSLSTDERNALVSGLNSGTETRATALRKIAEDADFRARETSPAFVLLQYFGYLRRNPDDPPEPGLNFNGYNFWLDKLNSFGGDYRAAEMVKAFLVSSEYRARFGQP